MPVSPKKTFKALILGEILEVDDIFSLEVFQQKLPTEAIFVREFDAFQEAIQDPTVDIILVDIMPHGLDALGLVLRAPPMRPMIMVANAEDAPILLEAKDRGLRRYVIRLPDSSMNVKLLQRELVSAIEHISPQPKMTFPMVEDLFRYAQYHNVRQPFFIVDLHRRLLYVNCAGTQMIEHLHGHRVEVGSAPEEFSLDDTPEMFNARLDRAFRGDEFDVMHVFEELDECEKFREIFYQPVRQDERDEIVAVSIACRNIGARREAEKRFERREEVLWQYFEKAPLAIKVVREDLTIDKCNRAFVNLLGIPDVDKAQEHLAAEFLHPDDVEEVREMLGQLFDGSEGVIRGEHRYYTADDREVWVNHIGFEIGNNGGPRRALVAAVDITRMKEAEKRVERAMRMEAIGSVTGGVAHDFNNILTVVDTFSQLLFEEISEGCPQDELLDDIRKIRHAARNGMTLTRQLLNFSRKQKIEKTRININAYMRENHEFLQRALGDDIELHYELEPDLSSIEIGEGEVNQVVMNLAVNARDAMPEGGRFYIKTRQVVVDSNPAEAPDMEEGDWVVLEARDTGFGMSRETCHHLFEPFYTTKEKGEGTGMGLATVYRIVERAGGKIFVDSEPQEGTTFTIYLPAVI